MQNLLSNNNVKRSTDFGAVKIIQQKPTEEPNSLEDIKTRVGEYNIMFENNLNIYKEKKEENDEFMRNYNLLNKMAEENSLKKPGRSRGPEVVFRDLIYSYRQKGYKIPDFSTEKNLFKPSALLLDENKLVAFYKNLKDLTNVENSKELCFLHSLNSQLNDLSTNAKSERKEAEKSERRSLKKAGHVHVRQSLANQKDYDDDYYLRTEDLEDENKQMEKENKLMREKLKNHKTEFDSSMSIVPISLGASPILKPSRITSLTSKLSNTYEAEEKDINSGNHVGNIKSKIFHKEHKKESSVKFLPLYPENSEIVIKEKNVNVNEIFPKDNSNHATIASTGLNTAVESANVSLVNNLENLNKDITEMKPQFMTPVLHKFKHAETQKLMTMNTYKSKFNHKSTKYLDMVSAERSNFSRQESAQIVPKKLFTNNLKFSKADSVINLALPPIERVDLESLYEKTTRRENRINMSNTNNLLVTSVHEDIERYLKEHNKYDFSSNQDKILPKHLMRIISDLKKKVARKDVYSSYQGLSDKVGNVEIDVSQLKKVKDLDHIIFNLEKYFIKSMSMQEGR